MTPSKLYRDRGFVTLDRFLNAETLKAVHTDLLRLETRAREELASLWNGQKVTFFTRGDSSESFVVTPYFQASADAVHIFFEEIEGQLVLNRLGHGLHLQDGFAELIYENRPLHELLRALGYRRPICLLSVYIPKWPRGLGSEVKPHQESTFAHTEPLSACVLWIALDDATRENACMYGLPGSQALPLKALSKVDHVGKRREYETISQTHIPEFRVGEGPYVPLEVGAGDAILFHGNFVHCSPANTSHRPRRALSFQFIETEGTTFSAFNWIRRRNDRALFTPS